MGMPLRGELTRTTGVSAKSNQSNIDDSVENIDGILSHFVRLSGSGPKVPTPTVAVRLDGVSTAAPEVAKPWSWTAAEAASTGAALVPFLVHLATARDDLESLQFCLAHDPSGEPNTPVEGGRYNSIAGGAVNCLDAGSGRSPLHVAAINGSLKCAKMLLESGALVHQRDSLGHTALYYVGHLLFQCLACADLLVGCASRPRERGGGPGRNRREPGRLRRGVCYTRCGHSCALRGPDGPRYLGQDRDGFIRQDRREALNEMHC